MIEVRRDMPCQCEKSVPGIIKYPHHSRSDETACLICLRKIDIDKALADMEHPEQLPGRMCRAFVKALEDMHQIARIPRNLAQIHKQTQRIVYLESTLFHMGYKPLYHDEGDFWSLEKVQPEGE